MRGKLAMEVLKSMQMDGKKNESKTSLKKRINFTGKYFRITLSLLTIRKALTHFGFRRLPLLRLPRDLHY